MALVKDHPMMSGSSFAYNMGDLSEMGLKDGGSSSSFDKPMSSSDELMFQADDHDQDSLIHFNHGSFLSFQQNNCHSRILWNDNNGYIQTATTTTTINPHQKGDSHTPLSNGDWFYSNPIASSINADNHTPPPKSKDATSLKRPNMGENTQALKKQCNNSTGKRPKPKSAAPSKDPQSIAAKNRRERISERLKTLQELVPNGCKVDLVTMLEKAISYVKFLQVQVKVLATDEFWPSQGGKAPDISQVKEAIDAILSPQRDRNSSSSTN